ncbi:DUF2484 family protein [Yoonia sp. 208BN28-4]|uniref:DUF2484 family protein n=1 Tax=Yoonia sp. 208BN28-4 TaxID=3126505 RepID=UPI0030A68D4B
MTLSLIAACIWIVLAAVLAMLPSNDDLWRRAYFLIAIGVPLVGWVTYENGPWIGMAVLAAGMSFLRWPMLYLGRWVKRQIVRG